MSKTQVLTILFLIGLIACNNSDSNSEKAVINENNMPANNDTFKEIAQEIILELDSSKNNKTNLFSVSELPKKKLEMKPTEVFLLAESVQPDKKSYIISGFVRNVFVKDGSNYHFKRIVKQDEDSRVGCNGGGNELSFTIKNPSDTFLIENEMLNTINFKYHINGGLNFEDGENPNKGKVKGILLPDNNWQIEINLWIKMTDLQLNKEIERQIIVNDKFIL
jgi:hypothetical protein